MLSADQRRRIAAIASQILELPPDWVTERLISQLAAIAGAQHPLPRGMRPVGVSHETFASNADERGRIGNIGRLQRRLNRAFRADYLAL